MPMDRQQVIDFYMSPDGGGLSPEAAAAKADAKMKADPSRFAGSAPKPAAKAPPKTAPKVETKAPPPAATVVRKETVTAAPAITPSIPAPSLPMRAPQPQSVYGGPYPSEGEAMTPDRYQRFVDETKKSDLTQGLQYLGNRAMGALSRTATPSVRTSDIMVDDTRRPTARSFVSTADAAVPMSAPPRAAQYVSGGGGRMSEYARTGPSDARAVLKGMRPDLAADIDAAGDDEVEELYTQYRAAR